MEPRFRCVESRLVQPHSTKHAQSTAAAQWMEPSCDGWARLTSSVVVLQVHATLQVGLGKKGLRVLFPESCRCFFAQHWK